MFTKTHLMLGLLAIAIPSIAAEGPTIPPVTFTTPKDTITTTPQAITPTPKANIVEGIDYLIGKVAADYKSVNNGFIRIPNIKKFMSPDIEDGVFGDLSQLQRVSADRFLVRQSPEQENPKTVSFQITLPNAIVKYNKIQIGFGFFIPTRQLTCLLSDLVYYAELSINYTNNGCVANLSKFRVDKKGDSKCKITGGYISLIDDFLSNFANEWKGKLVNTVKENISNAIQTHLKIDFDCEKYRTRT